MIQGAVVFFAIIMMFVLISGLVILLRRGPAELDAWVLLSHAYCAAISGVSDGRHHLMINIASECDWGIFRKSHTRCKKGLSGVPIGQPFFSESAK